MTTKSMNISDAAEVSGPDGPMVECGAGTHWDEATKTCVPDGESEVVGYQEAQAAESDASAASK
jgi:hypothetical protein